jgi:hypothetical protein
MPPQAQTTHIIEFDVTHITEMAFTLANSLPKPGATCATKRSPTLFERSARMTLGYRNAIGSLAAYAERAVRSLNLSHEC